MEKDKTIPVWKVSKELRLDRSNLLKDIKSKKYGSIELKFIRDKNKQNQKVVAISKKDYLTIKNYRIENGFEEKKLINYGTNNGIFYIIQTNPHNIPKRYKFGFTSDLDNRIRSYKSVCPNMKIIKKFKCDNIHELPLLRMVSTYGNRIGQEVYEIENINRIIKEIKEALNKLLPKANQ